MSEISKVALVNYCGIVFLKVESVLINLSDCTAIDIQTEVNSVDIFYPEHYSQLENLDKKMLEHHHNSIGRVLSIVSTEDVDYPELVRSVLVSDYSLVFDEIRDSSKVPF